MMLYKVISRLAPEFVPNVISLTKLGVVGEQIRALGVPVDCLEMQSAFEFPSVLWKLAQKIRQIQPDLVSTWLYHADFLGGIAAKFARAPAIAWNIRTSELQAGQASWATRQLVKLCALISKYIPDVIICCSEVARKIHIQKGYDPRHFVIIPNGFDLARFRPDSSAKLEIRKEFNIPQGSPLVGMIARFDPQKNHKGFLDAAAILHRRFPGVYFLLVGHGIDAANHELVDWIRTAGIEDVTRLAGLRQDIPKIAAALDISVLTSTWGEAFPNVVGEAMACGVFCVVTDVGDSAYIVGDIGKVVSITNMLGLADACQSYLAMSESERFAVGENARNRVKSLFELAEIVKRYETTFRGLIKTART